MCSEGRKVNSILSCIRKNIASNPLPLLSTSLTSGVMGPVLEFPVQQRYIHNKANLVKDHRNDQGLEHLMCEWILKELELFSLQKRSLKGESHQINTWLGRSGDERTRIFSMVPSDRTRGTGHTLKYKKLNFFFFFFRSWLNSRIGFPERSWGLHPSWYSEQLNTNRSILLQLTLGVSGVVALGDWPVIWWGWSPQKQGQRWAV